MFILNFEEIAEISSSNSFMLKVKWAWAVSEVTDWVSFFYWTKNQKIIPSLGWTVGPIPKFKVDCLPTTRSLLIINNFIPFISYYNVSDYIASHVLMTRCIRVHLPNDSVRTEVYGAMQFYGLVEL